MLKILDIVCSQFSGLETICRTGVTRSFKCPKCDHECVAFAEMIAHMTIKHQGTDISRIAGIVKWSLVIWAHNYFGL